ncbi:MAG: cell division protein FtsZ, partial [Patescibacteria group bacterium]
MGIGVASGENRAGIAARQAISSPLLEVTIDGAKGILFNIIAGNDLSMSEVDEAAKIISGAADADANIIFGATIDETMIDQIKITVIATGFDEARQRLRELSKDKQPSPPIVARPYAGPVGVISENPEVPEPSDERVKDQEEFEDEFDIPAFLRQGK